MTTTINNEHKKLNVPNLRFPEFQGEWEEYTLQDVVTFSNGKAHENCVNDDGDYILVNSKFVSTNGQVQKRVTSQLSPLHKSQFVMVMSDLPNGKALAKCFYVEEDNKYTLNQRVCSFTSNDGNVSRFLMYQINRNKYYLRFDDGINQTNLKKSEVLSCPVFIPIVREQEKIATLLCKIDERIATQNKIIEDLKKLKSAIIEIEYSPKDSYHSHIGGAIVQISKRNKDNHLCNVLSVSNRQGFIKQSEQFEDRNVASDDTSNYKIVEKNDFAYNPARINVGSIARLTKFETGIVSPMYICFRTKDCLLPEYLELFFESRNFFYHIQKRLEGSVRLCLSYEELCNIPIVIPSIEKQKQVDLHLSKLAQKIDLEMKILQFVQQQKTYLLHQMFI